MVSTLVSKMTLLQFSMQSALQSSLASQSRAWKCVTLSLVHTAASSSLSAWYASHGMHGEAALALASWHSYWQPFCVYALKMERADARSSANLQARRAWSIEPWISALGSRAMGVD